jgi:hypothetical protein
MLTGVQLNKLREAGDLIACVQIQLHDEDIQTPEERSDSWRTLYKMRIALASFIEKYRKKAVQ